MEFEVLGRIRIRCDGREVTPAGNLQQVLLAMLLSHPNSVVSGDALVDAMWGGRPDGRAASNLHVHVHRLRRLLPGPDRLISEPGGYRLAVHPGELDAERFESLLDEGAEVRAADPRRAAELIRKALGLWRGRPFGDVDVPELSGEAHRLTERRLAGIEDLYTAEIVCGRHAAAVADLTELVRRHPLHERLHGLLMVALYRSGRQDRALAAYRTARRLLIDELGQEPGPELRGIERRIIEGRPVELDPERPGTPPPAQLPHDIRGFTGREAELSTLDRMLDEARGSPPRIAAVCGTGGAGKTALAVHWAHRVRERFPDGQLYVDLHGFGPDRPVPPEDALAGFLRELGVASAAIPAEPADRAARFRTLVAGRRMLIVLDNAGAAEQVRPLLPGGPSCLVLITSRDALAGLVAREGAQRIPLGRLPREDAFDLLRELGGTRVDAEAAASAELVERCARLPLALRIAAELINTPPHPDIAELAAELADDQHTLDVLDAGGDPATAVRAVFSRSYQRLSPVAARFFRLLGTHPGHDIDVRALAALAGGDPAETRRAVRELLRAHLLEETGVGRYRMHDLLCTYAIDLCGSVDGDGERRAAVTKLAEHYLSTASLAMETVHDRTARPHEPQQKDATPEDATEWLGAELANLVAIARHAVRSGEPSTATALATTLHRYLSLNGRHEQALVLYQTALDAAQQLGDLVQEGNAYRYLGTVHRRLGRLLPALEYMQRAYGCYRQAGHKTFLQIQLNHIGVTCTFLGRYSDALDHLGKALAISDECGTDGKPGHVGTLSYLGQAHFYLGEPERALEYVTEALDHGADQAPRTKADAETIAGFACDRLGRYEQARHHFERARSMAKAASAPLIQAYAAPLAHVYWQLGRHDDAYDWIEHCLAITQRTGERTIEAGVRNTFGLLHQLAGAHNDALSQYHAALELAETGSIPYDQARAHTGIGDVHQRLRNSADAHDHWQQALNIYARLGTTDADTLRAKLR